MTKTPLQIARDVQEREHELFPHQTKWKHKECRVCGPGPLQKGRVPSHFPHVFYKTDKELVNDEYGSWWAERRTECMPEYAQVVSSELDEKRGYHTVMLDVDLPGRMIESSTPGHHHLYIDRQMPWRKYKRFLRAAMRAGIIDKNYYKASIKRKGTHLRPPWADKEA